MEDGDQPSWSSDDDVAAPPPSTPSTKQLHGKIEWDSDSSTPSASDAAHDASRGDAGDTVGVRNGRTSESEEEEEVECEICMEGTSATSQILIYAIQSYCIYSFTSSPMCVLIWTVELTIHGMQQHAPFQYLFFPSNFT